MPNLPYGCEYPSCTCTYPHCISKRERDEERREIAEERRAQRSVSEHSPTMVQTDVAK